VPHNPYRGCPLASPRFTCTLLLPLSNLSRAAFLASSEICILFTTAAAPDDFANRVAAPLCCTTDAFPSIVTTPPEVLKTNPFFPIFDFASRLCISACICASVFFGAAAAAGGRAWGGPVRGVACGNSKLQKERKTTIAAARIHPQSAAPPENSQYNEGKSCG
jgi:hypothetical protein